MKVGDEVLADGRAAEVLAGSRLCYLGVQSRWGPHVTPEGFAIAAGRLWVVTSSGTVKARSIRRRPEVGVLVRAGDGSLVLSGRAEILSLLSPREAARLAAGALPALEAVGRYGARNLTTMLGYALDLCRLPAGALPLDRVLVAIRPTAGLVLEEDEGTAAAPASDSGRTFSLDDAVAEELHPDVAGLLGEPADAAVGWSAPDGPVVLPGSWDPVARRASVPAGALPALDAPEESPACVTLDRSAALRPTRLRGIILRGAGRAAPSSGRVEIELRPERVTWWRGFETGTVIA